MLYSLQSDQVLGICNCDTFSVPALSFSALKLQKLSLGDVSRQVQLSALGEQFMSPTN